MKGLFVYETPHPAHRVWAESVGCEVPTAAALSKPAIASRFKKKTWYRRLARTPALVRRTIEMTARDYSPPGAAPDLVVFEGWRQTACARHFPDSFKVLIGADWFPFVFRDEPSMQEYLRPFDLIVSVSEVHSSYIPSAVNPNVVVVHPSMEVEPTPPGDGPDCAFVGDVFEDLKGVPSSVQLFERAFDDGRLFHVIGACDDRLAGRRKGNVVYHGRVPDPVLEELMAKSRYYLHWATFDPHPVSTVEAMAHGLLPVTSPTTGTHYLSVELLGEAFDVPTVEQAAHALRELDASGAWAPLRARCQEASRRYTVENSMREFRTVVTERYHKWAATKKGP